jgi:hypothetical protein
MEKRVHCTACKKPFEAVGQGTMREVPEGVTCPYCHTPNEVQWPMDGAVFGRAIPAFIDQTTESPRFDV